MGEWLLASFSSCFIFPNSLPNGGYFTFNKLCSAYSPTGPSSLRHKLAFNVEGESRNKDELRVDHADTTRVELDDHPQSDQLWEDLTYAYDFPTANTTNADEFFELIIFHPI